MNPTKPLPPPPSPNEAMTEGRLPIERAPRPPYDPVTAAIVERGITGPPDKTMTEGRPFPNYGLTCSEMAAGMRRLGQALGGPQIVVREPFPWPRVWYYAWRLAAMLAWGLACWALAEMTK